MAHSILFSYVEIQRATAKPHLFMFQKTDFFPKDFSHIKHWLSEYKTPRLL
jgi:hypothetical protein